MSRPGVASHQRQRTTRLLVACVALALSLSLTNCKPTAAAGDAADALARSSEQLSKYYDDLAQQVEDTMALNQIQAATLRVPFEATDQEMLSTMRKEVKKREAMAKTLARLGAAYTALAKSTAPSDVSGAATDCANALKDLGALPGGVPIPDIVGQAGRSIVEAVQARKLRQSSVAISQSVSAVSELFDKEKPAYISINKQRVVLAQSIARKLLDKNMVDVSSLLSPALTPFSLAAQLPANQVPAEYRELASKQIEQRGANEIEDFNSDTNHLAQSLKDVRDMVQKVASVK